MATSFSSVQLERFRREAKKLSRELSITRSEALDRIAAQNGFTNWSLLSKHSGGQVTLARVATLPPLRPFGAYRYYLHGDVVEDDPSKCYCARCDVFWPADHLMPTSYHTDGKDGERFLSSLTRWNKLPAEERGRKFRPDGASNVLEASARAAEAAHEAARSPFHRWLDGQRSRNDPVGDVAGDIVRDEGFPIGASTRREVEEYLEGYGLHVIRAVRQAWREFEGRETRSGGG
ncbi:YozE family protein [Variovorax paradoxus]|uniref:YozE family protein n=1 Tax=Variovorax paradoxus TaxID=34073 RepID=UPI003D645D90